MNFKKMNSSFASMVVSQVYLLNCDISTKENGSWNYNTEGEETHGDSTFILSKVVVTNKIIAYINKEYQRWYVGLSFGYVQHLNGNN